MKVQVLTSEGCTGCDKIEKILDDLDVNYELVDISKKPEFLEKFPVFVAPAVIIDDVLAFTGVPRIEELKERLGKQ